MNLPPVARFTDRTAGNACRSTRETNDFWPLARRMPRRRGFTLIELLVVILIIGLLIAILLPAVQAARESARCMHCRNNLKQIGLAMHNYHDVQKSFPPGAVSTYIAGNMNGWNIPGRTNWAISLLPYLEQTAIAEKYHHEADNHAPINAAVREQAVPVYLCPSDITIDDEPRVPGYGLAYRDKAKYHTGSYRGMAGRAEPPYTFIADNGTWVYSGFYPLYNAHPEWKGLLHIVGRPGPLSSCEAFATIADGTSNTIAVGERHGTPDEPQRDTFWAFSTAMSLSDANPNPANLAVTPKFWSCYKDWTYDRPCQFGWGTYHSGGLNWLLCDGSARLLSRTMDMTVFCSMATIAGGEVVSEP